MQLKASTTKRLRLLIILLVGGAVLYSLIEQRSNWTWGCISLKNRDVDELYRFVGDGTLVEIVP